MKKVYDIPFVFGISGKPQKDFEVKQKHEKRLAELLELEHTDLIVSICKHYLQHFIPTPVENENEYWMCSCFPGDDFIAIRFNIYWHEVLNIQPTDNTDEFNLAWRALIFTDSNFLTKEVIAQLEKEVEGFGIDRNFRYEKGLDNQLAIKIPIESYFDLVKNEFAYESIRQYNYQLSCKGRRVHQGHNFSLARVLLTT